MNNNQNQVSFLRTTRKFPHELEQLAVEVDRAYVDIAGSVNSRTVGIFSVNRPNQDGETWFVTKNQRQQGYRQVYAFTGAIPATIPHNLNLNGVERFTRLWGTYTDGTNWYGILAGSNVALAGQVIFYIDATNIVFLTAGAPVATRGNVVIEWIGNP